MFGLNWAARTPRSLRTASIVGCLPLALLSTACSRDPEAARAQHVEKAQKYSAAGKHAEAVIELRNAVQIAPQSGDLRVSLAEAYLKNGNGADAAWEYVRGADLLPDRADVQLKAGSLMLLGGRFDDAKVRAEKGLAIEPKNVELHILLANSLAGLKDLEAAMAEIEEALKLDPARAGTYANLGVLEVGRGKAPEAERAFAKAIELDPQSAAAHLAIANFYWVAGRLGDTEQALKRALTLDPNSVAAHRTLATFAASNNRASEAEMHLKKVVELTGSSTASLALADFYIWQKKDDAAREVLNPLANQPAVGAIAKTRLASLDHAAGRRDEAYRAIDGVISGTGNNMEALLTKTGLLLQDKRLDEALAAAEQAAQQYPDSAAASHALGRVHAARNEIEPAITAYQQTIRINPRATAARVALAQLHLVAGRSDTSVGLAEEAVTAEPDNPQARLVLVRALITKGDLARADAMLGVLTKQYPRASAVFVQQGILRAKRNDLKAAHESFETAQRLAPTDIEPTAGLIALELQAGNTAAARSTAEAALTTFGRSVPAMMLAGRTYFATGASREAEASFRAVLERDPSHLPAYAALGQLYFKEQKLEAAVREFEALSARNPKNVGSLIVSGMLLESMGRKAEAQKRYERALQIDPASPVAANNLAWMYAESGGNLDVALQLARTAHSKLPNSPEIGDTLGYIYYKKSLYPQAIQILKETVSKEPTKHSAHFRLGMAMAKSGDKTGATLHLKQALALNSTFEGAREASETLRSLETR